MGELQLCSSGLASIPYYIENIALNVYSLEELCYYLKENIDLVEPSFMEDELICWIEAELKLPSLAKKLEKIKQDGGSLSEFVLAVTSGCHYCSREETDSMQKTLAEFENKSETECKKIRADRLLQKKRYGASILEYKKLLGLPGVGGMLAGNIYHNLGTAYAGLFFFADAAICYEKAYEKNKNPLSRQQQQMAVKLMDGVLPQQAAEERFLDPKTVLDQWKEDYIKSCR